MASAVRKLVCRLDSKYLFLWRFVCEVWGNHIQRVKIVINDNIIEQVTDFKHLGYRMSEYGSDLEDKLQTYNKINGAIRDILENK